MCLYVCERVIDRERERKGEREWYVGSETRLTRNEGIEKRSYVDSNIIRRKN